MGANLLETTAAGGRHASTCLVLPCTRYSLQSTKYHAWLALPCPATLFTPTLHSLAWNSSVASSVSPIVTSTAKASAPSHPIAPQTKPGQGLPAVTGRPPRSDATISSASAHAEVTAASAGLHQSQPTHPPRCCNPYERRSNQSAPLSSSVSVRPLTNSLNHLPSSTHCLPLHTSGAFNRTRVSPSAAAKRSRRETSRPKSAKRPHKSPARPSLQDHLLQQETAAKPAQARTRDERPTESPQLSCPCKVHPFFVRLRSETSL